jgi:hypothetical protein
MRAPTGTPRYGLHGGVLFSRVSGNLRDACGVASGSSTSAPTFFA